MRTLPRLLTFAVPAVLFACTGKDEPANEPPMCVITSPVEGEIFLTGATVSLEAEVTDPEGQYVSVYWTSTASGAIADGASTTAVLPDGSQILTVQGLDDHGDACSDSVAVVVDQAPAIVVLYPMELQTLPSTSIALSATLSDPDNASTELSVTWLDSVIGDLGSATAGSDGTATVVTQLSIPGPHTLTATVSDPVGATASVTLDVLVDTAPEAPVVAVTPEAPGTDDDLVAAIVTESADAEGDPVTYGWLWYVDGVLSDASTTDTLPADATTRGEVWTARAVPNDGVMDGFAGEASVTIVNTPPSMVSVAITPDPLRTDDTAQAVVEAYDPDGDEVTLAWLWGVDGENAFVFRDTLSGLNFRRDQVVRVSVTPSDAESEGARVSAELTVVNTAPVPPTLVATPSPIEGLDDIYCEVTVDADDADADDVALTFAWTVDGVAYTDATTTAYAGDTVPAATISAGEVWQCSVSSTDGFEDGAVVTSSTTVRTCAGGDESCPMPDCQDALDAGGSGGDGLYWLDIDGFIVTALCDMTTDGGGWTLVERSSDDGLDSFTWDTRVDLDLVGDPEGAGDYRGEGYGGLGMTELLAVHQPSGTWVTYMPGDGSPLPAFLDDQPADPAVTWPMVAGTLALSGSLCSTDLGFNVVDPTSGSNSYGPTWGVDTGAGCWATPGATGGIGPNDADQAVESNARGFGEALGLNTGAAGAGENSIAVFVR